MTSLTSQKMGRTLYQCSVCDANPSKRHNVERHVWLQHVRKWMNLRAQEYQVAVHKKYVERYVRKQVVGGHDAVYDAQGHGSDEFTPDDLHSLPLREGDDYSPLFEQVEQDNMYIYEKKNKDLVGGKNNGGTTHTLPTLPNGICTRKEDESNSFHTTPHSNIGSVPPSPNSNSNTSQPLFRGGGDPGLSDTNMFSNELEEKRLNQLGFHLGAGVGVGCDNILGNMQDESHVNGNIQPSMIMDEFFLTQLATAAFVDVQSNPMDPSNHGPEGTLVKVERNLDEQSKELLELNNSGQPQQQQSYVGNNNNANAFMPKNSLQSMTPQPPSPTQTQTNQSMFFLPTMPQMPNGNLFRVPLSFVPPQQLESMYLQFMGSYSVGINPSQVSGEGEINTNMNANLNNNIKPNDTPGGYFPGLDDLATAAEISRLTGLDPDSTWRPWGEREKV